MTDGSPRESTQVVIGGYSAQAEGLWMGAAQAADVLEQARAAEPEGVRIFGIHAGIINKEFTIAQATILLMAAFLGSALLGAVRQILFNAEFGAGDNASAYYAAFRLPDTLFSLIAGGALSSAMIPVLLSVRKDHGEAASWRLASLVLTTLMAVFGVLIVAGIILTPLFISKIAAPGFDKETTDLAVTLTRIMMLQPLVLVAGSVAAALLNARNQFLTTSLSLLSHNVTLIAGILAVRIWPELGIYGPTIGVVTGAFLQVGILAIGLRGQPGRLSFKWDLRDSGLHEVVRLLIPNGLAVGVGYAGFIIDTSFASKAPEEGAIAAIQNAWLLAGLPVALLGQAAGQAAFPRLSAAAADADWQRMRTILLRTLAAVVLLAIPAVLILVVAGRKVVTVLFEHGEFDAAAGSLTTDVLTIYALGLPAYVATEVVTRGLIALKDTRTPLFTNVLQLTGRIVIVSLLLDSMGVEAIPLAFAVTAACEAVLMGAILAWKMGRRMGGATPLPVPA